LQLAGFVGWARRYNYSTDLIRWLAVKPQQYFKRGWEMRHVTGKAGRWDIALACGSLALVMLIVTGVFHKSPVMVRGSPLASKTAAQWTCGA
jgi:hypothetical protein